MNQELNNINTQKMVNQGVDGISNFSFSFGLGSIFIAILFVVGAWGIGIYNSLVQLRVKANQAWSNIDVQLKRRADLVPNLVEIVRGYTKHEQETLQKVIEARSKATEINIDANDITEEQMIAFSSAQEGLSGALGKLFALAENYPDLKANTNFLELQRQIEDTEDKIESSRSGYNATVALFNIKMQMFPGNIVAKIFNFEKKQMFEVENPKDREKVDVKF